MSNFAIIINVWTSKKTGNIFSVYRTLNFKKGTTYNSPIQYGSTKLVIQDALMTLQREGAVYVLTTSNTVDYLDHFKIDLQIRHVDKKKHLT